MILILLPNHWRFLNKILLVYEKLITTLVLEEKSQFYFAKIGENR
jgi:hypothetical protein